MTQWVKFCYVSSRTCFTSSTYIKSLLFLFRGSGDSIPGACWTRSPTKSVSPKFTESFSPTNKVENCWGRPLKSTSGLHMHAHMCVSTPTHMHTHMNIHTHTQKKQKRLKTEVASRSVCAFFQHNGDFQHLQFLCFIFVLSLSLRRRFGANLIVSLNKHISFVLLNVHTNRIRTMFYKTQRKLKQYSTPSGGDPLLTGNHGGLST